MYRARPIGDTLAAHLLRRSGFGVDAKRAKQLGGMTGPEAVDQLFFSAPPSPEFENTSASLRKLVLGTGNMEQAAAWWLYRMRYSPDSLREKMTLFWHGHFASGFGKVQEAQLMVEQNDLLTRHAIGDFRQLARGISRDPAMLIYLDSITNRKRHPNENFARELMELFCLGEGSYSEKDVQELARCFTGWEIKGDRFRFNKYQHDNDPKTLLGATGTFDEFEAVDLVVDHHSCPTFIVRKLVAFFVADEPAAPAEFLNPLVQQLRDDDMSLKGTLHRLFSSNIFLSEAVIGRKIRSPVELAVGMLQTIGMNADMVELGKRLVDLGQGLFEPPNVKGWPGGRAWINSSTLLDRANLVSNILQAGSTSFEQEGLEETLKMNRATEPETQVRWLLGQLLAVDVPEEVVTQLLSVATRDTDNSEQRLRNTVSAIAALPEFQLN